jgi:LiaI-LiaF-like transmembrane region
MDSERHSENGLRPGAIAGGAIMLVVGVALLLDRSGLVHAPFGQLVGPLVLMTLGGLMLVEKGGVYAGYHRPLPDGARPPLRRRGGVTSGLWLMGLGVWMLVSQLHLWGFDFHNSWPLVVILSGVIILVRGLR